MSKKIFITLSIILLTLFCSFTYCFANTNMAQDAANGVRNFVSGAENVVENAGSTLMNGIRTGIDATGNVADNMMNTTSNTTNGMLTTDNNSDYNATRTATTRSVTQNATTDSGTFLGMDPIVLTWLIMGILGIATVGLVWYYGKQKELSYNHNDDKY